MNLPTTPKCPTLYTCFPLLSLCSFFNSQRSVILFQHTFSNHTCYSSDVYGIVIDCSPRNLLSKLSCKDPHKSLYAETHGHFLELALTKLQQNLGEVCVFMYVTQHELQKGSNAKHTYCSHFSL